MHCERVRGLPIMFSCSSTCTYLSMYLPICCDLRFSCPALNLPCGFLEAGVFLVHLHRELTRIRGLCVLMGFLRFQGAAIFGYKPNSTTRAPQLVLISYQGSISAYFDPQPYAPREDGRPVGVQLVAPFGGDGLLLSIGAQLEQSLGLPQAGFGFGGGVGDTPDSLYGWVFLFLGPPKKAVFHLVSNENERKRGFPWFCGTPPPRNTQVVVQKIRVLRKHACKLHFPTFNTMLQECTSFSRFLASVLSAIQDVLAHPALPKYGWI